MDKIRLRELIGWPPSYGGARQPGTDNQVVSPDQIVERVAMCGERRVEFYIQADPHTKGTQHPVPRSEFRSGALAEAVCKVISARLSETHGETISALGDLWVEWEDAATEAASE